jgi:hypothetical protein
VKQQAALEIESSSSEEEEEDNQDIEDHDE